MAADFFADDDVAEEDLRLFATAQAAAVAKAAAQTRAVAVAEEAVEEEGGMARGIIGGRFFSFVFVFFFERSESEQARAPPP